MAKKVLYFFVFLFSFLYLGWRTFFTLPFHDGWFALAIGILLLYSEMISSFTGMLLIWNKQQERPLIKPEVADADFPHVDVLIATHNEEVDLLLKTVNACVNMKYPDKSKVHIYLSDDTNRPEVKALADKFGIGYVTLTNNKHAKSGNLNNALSKTSSPLVATFDADMIPYSDFLMESVPYFINQDDDEKPLGLVQTPQSFYNADVFQYNLYVEHAIPNEQDFFSREINILNNSHGAAIYTGSNTVISREAIEKAGGFPVDTLTEDFELGARINMAGYRSISTLEPMASGLTPEDIPSVIKQRVRWGRGVIQSVRNIRLLTNRQLTFKQKLVFLNGYLYWWSFARRLLFIAAPILFTVFDVRVVVADFWLLLAVWLPQHILLHIAMSGIAGGLRTQGWAEIQEMIMAPYMVIPVLMESLGIKEKTFKVTNKGASKSRKDTLYLLPHLIMLSLAVIGLIRFNYDKFGLEIMYGSVVTFWLSLCIFNLSFGVLFFMGRPLHRHTERFLASYPITIEYGQHQYQLLTHDISEGGLAFTSDRPLYFPNDEDLKLTIQRGDYQAHLTGRVVRVRDDHYHHQHNWIYGVKLNEIDEPNYLQYLQIIYDGFNKNLPQERDVLVTALDCLIDNIDRRLNNLRKQEKIYRLATLEPYERIALDSGKARIRQFDFQEMILEIRDHQLAKKELAIEVDGVSFELENVKDLGRHRYLYQVKNLAAIEQTPALIDLLDKWSHEKEEDQYAIDNITV